MKALLILLFSVCAVHAVDEVFATYRGVWWLTKSPDALLSGEMSVGFHSDGTARAGFLMSCTSQFAISAEFKGRTNAWNFSFSDGPAPSWAFNGRVRNGVLTGTFRRSDGATGRFRATRLVP